MCILFAPWLLFFVQPPIDDTIVEPYQPSDLFRRDFLLSMYPDPPCAHVKLGIGPLLLHKIDRILDGLCTS
jgi:hypothetical protein